MTYGGLTVLLERSTDRLFLPEKVEPLWNGQAREDVLRYEVEAVEHKALSRLCG